MTAPTLTRAANDWRAAGNCVTAAVNMHPDDGNHTGEEAAKKVCAGCPVAAACIAESLRLRDWHGIRAGLTGPERRNLAKTRTASKCVGCGATYVPRLRTQVRCRTCSRTYRQAKR